MSFWSDEMKRRLKEIWQSGASARMCAEQLNFEYGTNLSRNSCIGQINRLGSARDRGYSPKAPRTPAKAAKPSKPSSAPIPAPGVVAMPKPAIAPVEKLFAPPKVDAPTGAGAAVLALKPGECKWPVNDPRDDDFHFCGCKAIIGRSYCHDHVMRSQRKIAAPHATPEHMAKKIMIAATE